MSAPARSLEQASLRRGACPGLSTPMATGDGLLARLTPSGSTILLDAFAGLCAAARTHGNGIIEITSRGSIQVRGLRADSAPLFAADVAALRIEAGDGIPVVADPLHPGSLVTQLRNTLATAPIGTRLSAKVSVVIDLSGFAGDVVLRSMEGGRVHIALGGDAATAVPLGAVPMRR